MTIEEQGKIGEIKQMAFYKRLGWKFIKPDAVGIRDGEVAFFEFKAQEPFEPPPFYGHGLPPDQADHYLEVERITGIKTYFSVLEPGSDLPCAAPISKLEKGNKFETHGLKPRRVYDKENLVFPKL